jgi:membrane-bound metal-dependent hydrolase YbcI (DUF457 family)
MAGAITAWAAEAWENRAANRRESTPPAATAASHASLLALSRRSLLAKADRLADALSPLTVACVVLAVAPDFDVFFHTHRTYSHSLGAAAIVWGIVALVAWRLRLPVVRTASICAGAYGSHLLLDWLGRDSRGLMALWPLSTRDYRSGLDLFFEFTVLTHRGDLVAVATKNVRTLARELLVFGVPFAWMLRLRLGRGGAPKGSALGFRPSGLSAHGAPKPKLPESLESKA